MDNQQPEAAMPQKNPSPIGAPPDPVPPEAGYTDQDRFSTIRRIIFLGALGAGLAGGLNVWLFFQTGAWQMLAVIAGQAAVIACLVQANRLAWRQKLDAAAYVTLLSMALALGIPELFHIGVTFPLAVGGVLMMLIVGSVVLPHKRTVWLGAAVVYAAYFGLVNSLEPIARHDVSTLGLLQLSAPLLVGALGLAALWQLFRFYQRIITIRIRLSVSFVLVAVLSVLAVSAILFVVGSQSGQRQAIAQLDSVAKIKEAEINSWMNNLQIDLDAALSGNQVMPRAITLLQTPNPSDSQLFWMRSHLQQVVEQTARLEKLFLVNSGGQTILSSDLAEQDIDHLDQNYFQQGLTGFYVQPPTYSDELSQLSIIVARPVLGPDEQTLGVLVGQVNPATLSDIMGERAWLGETGELFLVDRNRRLLTDLRFGEQLDTAKRIGALVDTQNVNTAIASQGQSSGSSSYTDYQDKAVVEVYRWLPELQVVLLAKQNRSEALRITNSTLGVVGYANLFLIVAAVIASLFVTRSIARPIADLTETATRIADGDLTLAAPVEREDEIGALARAFNSMTAQLRQTLAGLEQQVTARTHDIARRSAYLEAAAEVGSAVAALIETERLMRHMVELVRERFDLYYVGLFQTDEGDKWAVLRAGTGQAGRAMLARGHRIQVGEGMIGWSIAHAESRVALEAGEDAVQLSTPELPDTRSEAAIPLRSRGRVIGALSVQSDQPEAFDEDLITALQIAADQMAVAIENTRLLAESREALEAAERAYGAISREAWSQFLQAQSNLAFRRDQQGISRVAPHSDGQTASPPAPDVVQSTTEQDDDATLVRPVRVREQVIGTLNARKSGQAGPWSAEETKLLDALLDQLGQALEGARLYQETQLRAHREQLARQITEKVRAAPNIETIAQTAAEELVKALGGARGFVKLNPGEEIGNGHTDQNGS